MLLLGKKTARTPPETQYQQKVLKTNTLTLYEDGRQCEIALGAWIHPGDIY